MKNSSRMVFGCLGIVLALSALLLPISISAKTDLPLPRFVSMREDESNVRSGPGLRYPIKWVLKRENMPLEVIAEFEQWRQVRDIQGDEGWIHRSQLSNKRYVTITGETQVIYDRFLDNETPVARLEVGVHAALLHCKAKKCMVEANDLQGWIDRNHLWGVYPNENF